MNDKTLILLLFVTASIFLEKLQILILLDFRNQIKPETTTFVSSS